MKKGKKKLKGMTLVEMIISIAIFGIMGGLLILVGTHVDATTRAGNTLKNKVQVESPYAANHRTEDAAGNELPTSEIDISVKLNVGSEGHYYVKTTNAAGEDVVLEEDYGPNIQVDMKADKYQTEGLVTDGMTAEQIEEMRKRANGGLNLEFFDVQPTTAPTT